ncbi:MAG: phosphatidate cytidylyltransferase [Pseudomonadota bacterium]|nr:phosphatidate cytidylyltransferase [Pseudomonadota bacterium]
MLKQRILTALVLLPLTIGAVLGLSSPWFAVAVAAVWLFAAGEWVRVMALESAWARGFSFVLLATAIGVAVSIAFLSGHRVIVDAVIAAAVIWWLVAALWVARFPAGFSPGTPMSTRTLIVGVLILVPSLLAMIRLHALPDIGPRLVLLLLVVVWAADSGAFFAGRRFGRHKLAPRVSPGKTWEGVLGGVILAVIAYCLAALALGLDLTRWVAVIAVVVMVVVSSVIGDLTESMFKRHGGMKDSGHLLPGHGGLLDRIDSLTAAAPVFWLGVKWGHLAS